jgi:hypothetical protein
VGILNYLDDEIKQFSRGIKAIRYMRGYDVLGLRPHWDKIENVPTTVNAEDYQTGNSEGVRARAAKCNAREERMTN